MHLRFGSFSRGWVANVLLFRDLHELNNRWDKDHDREYWQNENRDRDHHLYCGFASRIDKCSFLLRSKAVRLCC